jgi:SAM-dependent methyltransferase
MNFLSSYLERQHNVLDLGCARGEITWIVAEYVEKVVGIDHTKELIEIAIRDNFRPNITYIVGDALEYLQKEQNFDVLILSHILEHIDNPKKFLLDFNKYFKYIYIEVPDFDRSFLNIYRVDQKRELVWTDLDHVSEFDRQDLKDILNECNLLVISAEYRYGIQRYWTITERGRNSTVLKTSF